jgi:hypothetical protein
LIFGRRPLEPHDFEAYQRAEPPVAPSGSASVQSDAVPSSGRSPVNARTLGRRAIVATDGVGGSSTSA